MVGANRATALAATVLAAVTAALLLLPAGAAADRAKPFFGVHVRSIAGGDYKRMRRSKVGLVRTGFPIATARTDPDAPYDWHWFDRTVLGTARHGIDLLPVVYGVPPWLRGGLRTIAGDPFDLAWQDYLQALVLRYGAGGEFWAEHPGVPYRPVRSWQIWNEPNSFVNWSEPDPRQYGRFLARSARTVHRADPSARVIAAGIVAQPVNGTAPVGAAYLREMLRLRSVRRGVDAIATHPYTKTVAKAKQLIKRTRRVMDRAGLERTPIWVTEIGWGEGKRKSNPLIVSAAKQRRNLRDSFRMMLKERRKLRIAKVVWYQWRDGLDSVCGWCSTSGLLNEDGSPKQLLGEFRAIARR